ncbi:hypothetical protein Emag_007862 [Eimeria magna]
MPETRLEHSELSLQHQTLLAMQPPEVEQQILGGAQGRMPVTQQQLSPQHGQHSATQVAAESQQLHLLAQRVGLTIQIRS